MRCLSNLKVSNSNNDQIQPIQIEEKTRVRERVEEEFRGHLLPPDDQVDGGLHGLRDAESGQAEDQL